MQKQNQIRLKDLRVALSVVVDELERLHGIDYAAQTGRRLDLYVRPDTHRSGPLLEAISGSNGAIQLKFIP